MTNKLTKETTMSEPIKANQHNQYVLLTVVAVVIPIIGLITGIAYCNRDDRLERKLGEHLVVVSLLVSAIGALMYWFALSSLNAPYGVQ
jgi:hypothetical protein